MRQALDRIVRDGNRAGESSAGSVISSEGASAQERVDINAAIREVIELTRAKR